MLEPSAPVTPADRLRSEAEGHERAGQWERAADSWARLLQLDRTQAAPRDRLIQSLRHVHLARRHRDPSFRYAVAGLTPERALDVYEEVVFRLHKHYVDRDKSSVSRLYQSGVEELCLALTDTSFRQQYLPDASPESLAALIARRKDHWLAFPAESVKVARSSAGRIAEFVHGRFGLQPAVAILEMACGACNTLDEFTAFLPPGQGAEELATVAGELTTLGLTLAVRGDQLVVERVSPGSWAAQSGVGRGDRVLRLGRKLPERVTAELAGEVLRSEPAAGLRLEFEPADGGPTRLLDLPARGPSVTRAEMINGDHGIGYVRLASFQKNTPQELENALLTLKSQGMRALILDLRGNPGGLFSVALQLAERFLPGGVIVSTQGQNPAYTRAWTSAGGMNVLDLPVVLLVDGETASAAEVVVGAFKDNGRATVVGQTTYGKGSIQCVMQLSGVGGVRLTLARFFTPAGRSVSGEGVTPDVAEPAAGEQLKAAELEAIRLLSMAAMRP
jgi:carboxyl-terminal processing protease